VTFPSRDNEKPFRIEERNDFAARSGEMLRNFPCRGQMVMGYGGGDGFVHAVDVVSPFGMADHEHAPRVQAPAQFFNGSFLVVEMGKDGIAEYDVESGGLQLRAENVVRHETDLLVVDLFFGYPDHFFGQVYRSDRSPVADTLQEERNQYARAGAHIQNRITHPQRQQIENFINPVMVVPAPGIPCVGHGVEKIPAIHGYVLIHLSVPPVAHASLWGYSPVLPVFRSSGERSFADHCWLSP
jgi:hypothetical protein